MDISFALCNGLDDDCDGSIDEGAIGATWYRDNNDGDTYGNATNTIQACSQPAGYVANSTDCNDNNATTVHPGATEVCNGFDDDCDGTIDEGFQPIVVVAALLPATQNSKAGRTMPVKFPLRFDVWLDPSSSLENRGCY